MCAVCLMKAETASLAGLKWHLWKSTLSHVAGVTMCQDKPLAQNLGMLENVCLGGVNYLNYSFTGAQRQPATRVKPAQTVSFRIPRHRLHLICLCSSFSLFVSLLIICQCSPSLFCCTKPLQTRLLIQAHVLMLFGAHRHREINRASK